eukprot:CAMPEP_0177776998 /NCGR_PEP_ID=MMETSP0491_2-20121128/15035_1 /TAXON_ID=63592 /ORGANISM="Tetraselmis chuii, Strain PLY429" /LENGTH=140 /DNA_ID=CAMNT_0019295873 /DNA_START=786 /DNA_END=1209 /DNA_ORIENTATION=+
MRLPVWHRVCELVGAGRHKPDVGRAALILEMTEVGTDGQNALIQDAQEEYPSEEAAMHATPAATPGVHSLTPPASRFVRWSILRIAVPSATTASAMRRPFGRLRFMTNTDSAALKVCEQAAPTVMLMSVPHRAKPRQESA